MDAEVEEGHACGVGGAGSSQMARLHQRLKQGVHSEPGFPRARLRRLGRGDGEVQQPVEEEASMVLDYLMRGGIHRAASARYKGVSWKRLARKWRAICKGEHLGRGLHSFPFSLNLSRVLHTQNTLQTLNTP